MKHCPSCQSQYSDVTLSFCLQDGTPLVSQAKQSTIDTVAFHNPVTADNILPTREFRAAAPDQNRTQQNYQIPPAAAKQRRRSRNLLIAAMAVLPALIILGTGGAVGWWYISGQKQLAEKEKIRMAEAEQTSTKNIQEQPVPEIIRQPQKPDASPATAVDADAVRKEITDFVNDWKTAAENRKAAEYSARYGEKVDYLGKTGVTAAEIGNEIQKTFDAYSEIEIELSNMLVAVDAEGTAATALFDKEWSYEANPKLSEGKAHTKLHLQKVGSEWKIVTEKYLKVYYMEN